MNAEQKIIPYLWFDTQGADAARFYVKAFGSGAIGEVSRYNEASAAVGNMPAGSIMTVSFELEGHSFVALNGGPLFTFTPAVSFFVTCPTVERADALWGALFEGGTALMPYEKYPFAEKFGWLNDRFGVSWQIMPGGKELSIAPCLMFTGDRAGRAEQAMDQYVKLFDDAAVKLVSRYPAGGADGGTINHAEFTLAGQPFVVMDSAAEHGFTFTEAISLQVMCRDQNEVDHYWDGLTEGGEIVQCGWLKDRYGVSWQVTPTRLSELLSSPDPAVVQRVSEAFLKMKKFDIAALEQAARG